MACRFAISQPMTLLMVKARRTWNKVLAVQYLCGLPWLQEMNADVSTKGKKLVSYFPCNRVLKQNRSWFEYRNMYRLALYNERNMFRLLLKPKPENCAKLSFQLFFCFEWENGSPDHLPSKTKLLKVVYRLSNFLDLHAHCRSNKTLFVETVHESWNQL